MKEEAASASKEPEIVKERPKDGSIIIVIATDVSIYSQSRASSYTDWIGSTTSHSAQKTRNP